MTGALPSWRALNFKRFRWPHLRGHRQSLSGLGRVIALVAALPMFGCASPSQLPVAQDAQWQLVWSDEFEGVVLDSARWRAEESCWGGGNNERQCYTARAENVSVSDGLLHLSARREQFTGPTMPPELAASPNPQMSRSYTSGKIRTRGLASWRYGRVEFRARVPRGQGMWPAVWMMPADNFYGAWPRSGEIDILEAVNLGSTCPACVGGRGENRTISALHFGDYPPRNLVYDTRVSLPGGAQPADDFHVWALDWSEGEMRFYLDGSEYWRVHQNQWSTTAANAARRPQAPFDQPFYLMANLAVGGRLAEENNAGGLDPSAVPSEFLIDWIRVYQCAGDPQTGRACMGQSTESR